jgi:hypothetical protein
MRINLMSNLNNWLNTFKELNEQQKKPFQAHLVAGQLNKHEQNIYAVLHAAFILFNGSITQNQERLYSFWLASISEELILSEVVNQAQKFDGEKLKEAITLIESKNLFELILLDVLIFTRLDGTLSNELKQILNEWCQLLKINQDIIEDVIAISDHILGTNEPKQPILTATIKTLIENEVWAEFYINELNINNINYIIRGGIWNVKGDIIDVIKDISIADAILVFNNKSKVTMYDCKLNLTNVGLINPLFNFAAMDICFDNVVAKGTYRIEDKRTVLSSKNTGNIEVSNSHFEFNHARAFLFDESQSTGQFDHVKFIDCGNKSLLGGAIKYQEGLKFTNCQFEHCNAKIGGAAFLKNLTTKAFENCKFISCTSEHEWSDGINAGSLYFENEDNKNNIINCFIDNNISIYKLYGSENCCSMLSDTIIKGDINYTNSTHGYSTYAYALDLKSINKNGVDNAKSKNVQTSVSSWSELIDQEGL